MPDRPLRRADLPHDPAELHRAWRDAAEAAGEPEVDAGALATVDPDGRPSVRYVLARPGDARGLRFYTDTRSRKSAAIAAHPVAALAIHWPRLERQVRVEGAVELLDDADSDAYWSRRRRESQLSAWASVQDAVLADRAAFDRQRARVEERFAGVDAVPRPEWWKGYLLRGEVWEFWQGRAGRAHDRFRYVLDDERWRVERLSP